MPISFDPSKRATKVSWGISDRWLLLTNTGSNAEEPPIHVDFYKDEDGSPLPGLVPGVQVPQAFHEPPPGFDASVEPHTITSGDLLKTESTGGFPVKTIKLFRTWQNLFNNGGSALYMNLKGFPNKFRAKTVWVDPGTPGLSRIGVSVGLAPKGAVRAGVISENIVFPDGTIEGVGLGEFEPVLSSATFLVNQTTGKVTRLS